MEAGKLLPGGNEVKQIILDRRAEMESANESEWSVANITSGIAAVGMMPIAFSPVWLLIELLVWLKKGEFADFKLYEFLTMMGVPLDSMFIKTDWIGVYQVYEWFLLLHVFWASIIIGIIWMVVWGLITKAVTI